MAIFFTKIRMSREAEAKENKKMGLANVSVSLNNIIRIPRKGPAYFLKWQFIRKNNGCDYTMVCHKFNTVGTPTLLRPREKRMCGVICTGKPKKRNRCRRLYTADLCCPMARSGRKGLSRGNALAPMSNSTRWKRPWERGIAFITSVSMIHSKCRSCRALVVKVDLVWLKISRYTNTRFLSATECNLNRWCGREIGNSNSLPNRCQDRLVQLGQISG